MAIGDLAPWVAQFGFAGVLLWMLFTGRLYTRRAHDEAVSAERRRGDDWRDAYRAMEARSEIQDRQLAEILTFVRAPREAA